MGKGDKKTRRGKLFSGSYGVLRPRKRKRSFSVVSSTRKTAGQLNQKPPARAPGKSSAPKKSAGTEEIESPKPVVEEPKAEEPQEEKPKAEAPKEEAPKTEAPKGGAKKSEKKTDITEDKEGKSGE